MAVDYQLTFKPRGNAADIFAWRPDFLDEYQIKGYVKEIKNLEFTHQAKILGKTENGIEGTYDPSIRSSKVKWVPQSVEFKGLYERIAQEIIMHNDQHFRFDLDNILEQIQYTEYHAKDKGHYNWHMDLGSDWASLRKLSCTINLSDPEDYDGGVLEFNLGGKTKTQAPKTKGAITIFPSYLLHRVSPVTRGTRKSLVLWVGGNAFR